VFLSWFGPISEVEFVLGKREANWPYCLFLCLCVCDFLCFHLLEIFRAPVPIHKPGEMRQDYEKQKMKVRYRGMTLLSQSIVPFSHMTLIFACIYK